jgi:hypothetical protein
LEEEFCFFLVDIEAQGGNLATAESIDDRVGVDERAATGCWNSPLARSGLSTTGMG